MEDISIYSNLWIINAVVTSDHEQSFNDASDGKSIKPSCVYAIAKCNTIEDCYNIFIMGCSELKEKIKYINSIWDFQTYLEENQESNNLIDTLKTYAMQLKHSNDNFIITKISSIY